MEFFMSNTALGYALIMGAVLIAVIIYTVIKLRKQAGEAEKKEKEKKDHHH
ncbi:hypothetical protein [Salinimicrobium sp. TH3]|uniref:hypothetical protein n=1 Tax=Salinimicrobium sp. TH3 TaxID=2997342 RepID=UPI0022766F51|nr:hypothetical protein [Salinimicrobium sp. TH3]MCY2687654.1 hypothetical protein [Salinimicrobium sp. TH3]